LRKIFSVHQKFFTFPITNMWQVYTRPTSASDFFFVNRGEKKNVQKCAACPGCSSFS
jgi:hypothetical protein